MASSNSKKRKSPCSDLIFELSDDDVPPESEIPETNGVPKNKVLKFEETELQPEYGPQVLEIEKGNSTISAEPCDDAITTDVSPHEVRSPLVQISESIILPNDEDMISDELQSEITSPLQLFPQSTTLPSDDDITIDGSQNKVISPLVCIPPESTDIPSDDNVTIIPSDDDSTIKKDKALSPLMQSQEAYKSSISITFSDKKIADLYKYKFLKFLESFVEFETIDENDLSIRVTKDSLLDVCDCRLDQYSLEDIELEKTHVKHKKRRRKRSKRSSSPFVIDIKPERNSQNKSSLYSFSKFEIEVNNKPNDNDSKVCQPTQSCFNCAGSHSLKDCSIPKNHIRISAARNKHRSQYKNTKYQRYHISPDDQDYSHLRPGHISDKLRDALGLRKNELPSYVYLMRRLGYPPGWLEEAKIYHSDFDNNDSKNKIHLRRDKRASKLDPNKIVEYPGFNVPCDKNIKDEHRYYNVPPYSSCYHKSEMVKFYENISKPSSGSHDKDKDHAQERTKSSYETTEEITTPVKEKKRHMDVDLDLKTHSPTLLDLEEQKKNLLAALTESLSVASDEVTLNETEGNVSENSDIEKQTDKEKQTEAEEIVPLDTTNEEINSQHQDVQSIKSTIYGTPLLKSCTPYTKLPDAERFMKGVSPVINFENLPNSTGKYQQMRKILEKVRKVMNNSDENV